MRLSDGAVIPGNAYLTKEDIQDRIETYYIPYHRAIDLLIDEGIASGQPPVLLSIHSFTENWRGHLRPWHITVLWDQDPRFVHPFLCALKQDKTLVVGENQPYTGRLKGDCMYRHGTSRGLAHVLVEIRQDLIRTCEGQRAWAGRLADILQGILSDEGLRKHLNAVRYYRDDIAKSLENSEIVT